MAKFYENVSGDLLQSCTFVHTAGSENWLCAERGLQHPAPMLVKDEFVMEIMPLQYLLGRGMAAALFVVCPRWLIKSQVKCRVDRPVSRDAL